MTRYFGGPGNFEERYREAEGAEQSCVDYYNNSQRQVDRSYLIAYLAIVAIIFASLCFFWRFT